MEWIAVMLLSDMTPTEEYVTYTADRLTRAPRFPHENARPACVSLSRATVCVAASPTATFFFRLCVAQIVWI